MSDKTYRGMIAWYGFDKIDDIKKIVLDHIRMNDKDFKEYNSNMPCITIIVTKNLEYDSIFRKITIHVHRLYNGTIEYQYKSMPINGGYCTNYRGDYNQFMDIVQQLLKPDMKRLSEVTRYLENSDQYCFAIKLMHRIDDTTPRDV